MFYGNYSFAKRINSLFGNSKEITNSQKGKFKSHKDLTNTNTNGLNLVNAFLQLDEQLEQSGNIFSSLNNVDVAQETKYEKTFSNLNSNNEYPLDLVGINGLKLSKLGSQNDDYLRSTLSNAGNNEVNLFASNGNDFLLGEIEGNSNNNKLVYEGGKGNDEFNFFISDGSNNEIRLFGNKRGEIDNERDTFQINLAHVSENSKNNKIFVNKGVAGKTVDILTVMLPHNINPEEVEYDEVNNVLKYKGNEIHLGSTIKEIKLISFQYQDLDQAIKDVQADQSLSEKEKADKIELLKNNSYKNEDGKQRTAFTKEKVIKNSSNDQDALPQKVIDLIDNKTGDPEKLQQLIENLTMIYNDEEGKKLLDSLVKNGTKIELVNPEDDSSDGSVAAYFSPDDNKIVLKSPHANINTIVHELGHSVTGQSMRNRLMDPLNNLLFMLSPSVGVMKHIIDFIRNRPKGDGNSFEEELGTSLLALEIEKRTRGESLTAEEARDYTKRKLKLMLTGNGDAQNTYAQLKEANGFYKHLLEWLGITVDYKFDLTEIYKEILEEDKNNSVRKAPGLM